MHNNYYLVVVIHLQVTVLERFGRKNISLILVWTRVNDINASYSVSIKPQAAIILMGDTSVQIIADYNTLYN